MKALPIVKYKEHYKSTERSKVRELCKRMQANIVQALRASFPRAGLEFRQTTYYYNPIELE